MTQAARALVRNLEAAFGLPVLLQDERLTTFAVRDAIEEGRLPRPKRRDEPLDHYAAAVILEDALATLARAGGRRVRVHAEGEPADHALQAARRYR